MKPRTALDPGNWRLRLRFISFTTSLQMLPNVYIVINSSFKIQMKKKPVALSGVSDEVDGSVPDYKTVISFASKDQLNITLSKCGLHMLSNLGTVRELCMIVEVVDK